MYYRSLLWLLKNKSLNKSLVKATLGPYEPKPTFLGAEYPGPKKVGLYKP